MRLIGVEGEPLGVVTVAEALRLADEADLDLVEVAPMAEPPAPSALPVPLDPHLP